MPPVPPAARTEAAPEWRIPLAPLYRWSGPRLVWLCALGSAVISIFFFAPHFWLWCAAGVPLGDLVSIQPELNRAFFALQQLHDPWQRIDDVTNRVIEWRLFWPVVAHYGGLPAALYLALPHVGCVLALAAAATFAWRATQDALATAATALLVATSSWFFVSTGWLAYFDSWLILALLLASAARRRWVLFAAALVTPWIDERFILALPLCLGVRALGLGEDDPRDPRAWWRDALALAAGVAPYVAVRIGAELMHVRSTSTSYWADRPLLPAGVGALGLGVWEGLRLGWVAAWIAFLALARARRWLALVAVAASLLVNLCVADDLSRSMSIAVPLLLAGVIRLWRADPARARRVLPLLCAGNLLLPAAHIIATPASAVETFHRAPVLGLYAEIERRQNPPDFANPATYTRRGMDFFAAGNLPRALAANDLALRFDPDFAKARANRGILLFLRGQQSEGMAEIDRALARMPFLYEVRMQRGAFRQQLGDLPGALDDVRQALQDMPPDWAKHKEAEQFEHTLAAQVGTAR